ncbi:MAG: ribosomal protein [Actinomycetia bacterium]|nr:ribosomal protein [Actinomycetes bacterium]
MRHARAGKKLGRDSAHRKALYSNLAGALIEHGRIKTTVTKAKAVRPHVEHMITLGRRGDLHARRQATAFLRSRDVVHKLFADVAPLFKDRPGGYTRIIKIGTRPGDSAEMAYIELVDDEYVATQREERTPEPAAEEPVAEEPVVVPEIPVEAAEELPETEEELVEDPEAAAEVLATEEEAPADDAEADEPAAETEEPAAEAEGDEPAADAKP